MISRDALIAVLVQSRTDLRGKDPTLDEVLSMVRLAPAPDPVSDFVEISIDGIPAPPNQTRRQHWHANAEAAAAWRNAAKMQALYVKDDASRRFRLPFLTASVEYVFVLDGARGDLDNLVAAAKPLIDGLRDGGILADDSVSKLPLIAARWERGPRRGVRLRIRPFETGQIGLFE